MASAVNFYCQKDMLYLFFSKTFLPRLNLICVHSFHSYIVLKKENGLQFFAGPDV